MSLARTYAKAVFEAAKGGSSNGVGTQKISDAQEQLDAFYRGVMAARETQAALLGSFTSSQQKTEILKKLFETRPFSEVVQRFLLMLAEKGRMSQLGSILDALTDVRWEAEGGIRGSVVSAEPMSEADVQELAQSFTQKLGKKVSFKVGVDPQLLAGVRVTVQGVTYDGTLQSQLHRLKERLMSGAVGSA